ncbi:MAG: hypothetical protein ACRD2C_20540 [Acidimicrobiales bacterium]
MRQQPRSLRRVVAYLVTVVVGVMVGVVLGGSGDRSSPSSGTARPAAPAEATATTDAATSDEHQPTGPGPWSSVAGVGVRFEQSEAGATAAAVSYAAAAQSWLYLTDQDLQPAVEAVIAPTEHDRLVDRVVEDVQLLQDQLREASGTVWYVVAPLATSLDSYTETRAVVRVWVARVLSADGVAVPQVGWETLTLDLVWDGDWRVADITKTDGPVAQLESGQQPWLSAALDESLAGFVRVGVQ